MADRLTIGQSVAIEMEDEHAIEIAGHQLSLGRAAYRFAAATPVKREDNGSIYFEPAADNKYTLRPSEPPARTLDDRLASLIHLDDAFLASAAR